MPERCSQLLVDRTSLLVIHVDQDEDAFSRSGHYQLSDHSEEPIDGDIQLFFLEFPLWAI